LNGGCIYASGPVDVVDSELGACTAGTNGGAIFTAADLDLTRSTVREGSAARGGGIAVASGTTRVVNSTLTGNSATGNGGGITNTATTLVLSSTITENRADSDSDLTGEGGGVENTGTFTFTNTILAKNYETSQFGDIVVVVVGECLGTIASGGHDLVQAYFGSHCTITGPAPAEADPKLGPLKENGGRTRVRRPASDSDAVNHGSGCVDAFGATLTIDQRGVTRPIGGACDIGAVEREPQGDVNGDGIANVSDVFTLINSLFANGPLPAGRMDMEDDFSIGVDDVFYLINYLFAGGPAPLG